MQVINDCIDATEFWYNRCFVCLVALKEFLNHDEFDLLMYFMYRYADFQMQSED